MRKMTVVMAAAVAAVASSCASSGDGTNAAGDSPDALVAQVASYDVAAGRDQRVMVGLQKRSKLVSFGTAMLSFAYLGQSGDEGTPIPGPKVTGTWTEVPGRHRARPPSGGPRLATGAEGIGVYAGTVKFDRPGYWQVTARVRLDGKEESASAALVVQERPHAIAVGDPAPRTENFVAGSSPASAVDSRASDAKAIPDPELHRLKVSEAIASKRPTMVVISTPNYCVSRFCGPITDSVAALAREHQSRMNFIHLEVWRDFPKQTMNRGAAEWIYRDRDFDLNEPWVYVVDRRGNVVGRFDNVASDADLATSVRNAIAS